jgi:hypothetical protein
LAFSFSYKDLAVSGQKKMLLSNPEDKAIISYLNSIKVQSVAAAI